eukprot:3347595-Rhodomonas_salina.1
MAERCNKLPVRGLAFGPILGARKSTPVLVLRTNKLATLQLRQSGLGRMRLILSSRQKVHQRGSQARAFNGPYPGVGIPTTNAQRVPRQLQPA